MSTKAEDALRRLQRIEVGHRVHTPDGYGDVVAMSLIRRPEVPELNKPFNRVHVRFSDESVRAFWLVKIVRVARV